MSDSIVLNGTNLGVHRLVKYARSSDLKFDIDDNSKKTLFQAREVVNQALENDQPVYGLTTGLGAKVTETLNKQDLASFSLQTLRGRAHSLGDPMPSEWVRAAMIARLNTLAIGASGCSSGLPDFVARCLNKNLTPVVGRRGSIGVSDLCWGATMGLAFCGEGQMTDVSGNLKTADAALSDAGMIALTLEPKDGLVLANHSGFSAALSSFALYESTRLVEAVQIAAATTMFATSANFSPIDEHIIGMSQHTGQIEAAKQLREILEINGAGDSLAARKVQDVLSIRNVAQIHGAAIDALAIARSQVNAELNSPSDNPLVDVERGRILSAGGFLPTHLTLAVECVTGAISRIVTAQLARMSKLLSNRHSGLSQFLANQESHSNGFAPILKLADSLVGEIRQLTRPVDHWPSGNAEGVEDIQSNLPLSAQSLLNALVLCRELCAMELMFATQALELAGLDSNHPERIRLAYQAVRETVDPLVDDRPMGQDIQALASRLSEETFPGVGQYS